LDTEEQRQFLRAVNRHSSSRNKAIASLLFYTGLRISECVALNREDIALSKRKGQVVIRQGKGDRYREVPLNSSVRTALSKWLQERKDKFAASTETALFLSRGGKRLSRRSIDALIRRLGQEAESG
jgi:site-specific recombinase XerC